MKWTNHSQSVKNFCVEKVEKWLYFISGKNFKNTDLTMSFFFIEKRNCKIEFGCIYLTVFLKSSRRVCWCYFLISNNAFNKYSKRRGKSYSNPKKKTYIMILIQTPVGLKLNFPSLFSVTCLLFNLLFLHVHNSFINKWEKFHIHFTTVHFNQFLKSIKHWTNAATA